MLDVTEFGADNSGAADSTAAVAAALEAAKRLPGLKKVVFPQGTYQFYPDLAAAHELYLSNTAGADPAVRFKRFALYLEDLDDLTIDGQGSHFQLHGQLGLFAVIGSSRVTLTNFAFDHSAPRIIDLTVVETGPGYRIVSVPPGSPYVVENGQVSFQTEPSPYDGQPYWRHSSDQLSNGQQVFDPVAGLASRRPAWLFQNVVSVTDLGDRWLRIDYRDEVTPDGLGLVYSLREVTRDTAAGFIWQSKDVAVTDLKARYLHGFGILGQFSENIVVSGNEFVADRSTGRIAAAFADFVQMSGIKGSVTITGNTFDGAHDDAINIHGTYLPIASVDGRTLHLRYAHNETAGFPQFAVGDELEITHCTSLRAVGQAMVTAVTGPTGRDSNSLTTMSVTIDRDVPAEVVAGAFAVENITFTPSVHIAGNTFRNIPTRGALVSTRRKAVIEDNVFDGLDMSAILITADASGWFESGPVRDLTIRRNTFRRPAAGHASILINPENTVVDAATPVHENIRIEDNTFEGGLLVEAKSVRNLSIRNNHVQGEITDDSFRFTACSEVTVD
ncbi:right-handed parallel beta-helix repeat-containing protein [Kribbella antibiotica]|uniref:Right-handed parallel beta-helix repeat-containing protein n=1 Tax=Kribbella antibiotica TaxID=190195 RepID=A0A4R4YSX8_9ACTN|nr:right-handed parallel beta-helix repeat-containing protein [Kribbella antibiotica]TDD47339.1 right-handed parallel beta-helix repeat-containing protein [Kribbella antibiotica]